MAESQRAPQVGGIKVTGQEGGANQRQAPWQIAENQFVDGYNVDISKLGQWSRVLGDEPFGGIEAAEPGGIFQFRDNSTDQQFAWAVFGSELYQSDGDFTWNEKACGVSFVSDRLHMAVEGNWSAAGGDQRSLYISQAEPSSGVTEASGIVAFRGLNAADFSQNASYAPICIAYFQNRVWKANDQVRGDGNDLAWSELDDGLTYSPANELTIEAGLGGRITSIVPSRDNSPVLHIFKESAIVVMRPRWGDSGGLIPGIGDSLDTINTSIRVLTSGVGCVATRSVVAVPGLPGVDLLFLARDGVRGMQRADDDTQIGAGPPLTYNVPDWIARINFDFAQKAVAEFYDNAYWLSVPMDGAEDNTHTLRFDLQQQNWSLHDIAARDLRVIPFSKDERLFYQHNGQTADCSATGAAAATTYQVYRAENGDARPGGDPPEYRLETRAFDFGDESIKKHWHELSFAATVEAGETHFITIAYQVDFKEWTTLPSTVAISVPDQSINFGTDPLPWAAPTQQFVVRNVELEDIEPGYFLKLRFMDADDHARPTVYSMRLRAEADQIEFDNDS